MEPDPPRPDSKIETTPSQSQQNPNPNPIVHQPANRAPLPYNNIAIGVPAPRIPISPSSLARPSMSSSPSSHLRPLVSVRPQVPMPTLSQNYQGHGILRGPAAALPSTSTPSTAPSQQTSYQPWLSSQQGHPHMASMRPPQATSQILQQRTSIPQQTLQPVPATSQPTYPASNFSQENSGQQSSLSSRIPQPSINQHQTPKVQASPSPVIGHASIMHSRPTDNTGNPEVRGTCNRILSKRTIQELVNQVDPLENLDPEVEDVLVDIGDDFIDSVTTFGCSLAKHRKSNTLEAKDILLHLERTWNMTLPGFSGDEIKTYKKPAGNDIHKERLAVINKSLSGAEVNKSSAGQGAGTIKPTHNIIGS